MVGEHQHQQSQSGRNDRRDCIGQFGCGRAVPDDGQYHAKRQGAQIRCPAVRKFVENRGNDHNPEKLPETDGIIRFPCPHQHQIEEVAGQQIGSKKTKTGPGPAHSVGIEQFLLPQKQKDKKVGHMDDQKHGGGFADHPGYGNQVGFPAGQDDQNGECVNHETGAQPDHDGAHSRQTINQVELRCKFLPGDDQDHHQGKGVLEDFVHTGVIGQNQGGVPAPLQRIQEDSGIQKG